MNLGGKSVLRLFFKYFSRLNGIASSIFIYLSDLIKTFVNNSKTKMKVVYIKGKAILTNYLNKIVVRANKILSRMKTFTEAYAQRFAFWIYLFDRKFHPRYYLSNVGNTELSKLSASYIRRVSWWPKSRIRQVVLVILVFCFIFISDTSIKRWLLKFSIDIDGVGNLGNVGVSAWQLLGTIISVGLATIGIILQSMTGEKNSYRKKLLLHHFFSTQELDNTIYFSFFSILLVGLVLLFKEKLFLYPYLSEKLFFVYVLISVALYVFAMLIIASFNYLFPEKQDLYFLDSLRSKVRRSFNGYVKNLILIDYLGEKLAEHGFGIDYYFDDKSEKSQNSRVITTTRKGSIVDINLHELQRISTKLTEYVGDSKDGKQFKGKIYIEFGSPKTRSVQPLAKVHISNTSQWLDRAFNKAIVLSDRQEEPYENEVAEYHGWMWEEIQKYLRENNISQAKLSFKVLYDFVDEILGVIHTYKQNYALPDNAQVNKPPILTDDLRRQYYSILDNYYAEQSNTESLFTLNYFPFALMQRMLEKNEKYLFSFMAEMIPWVYSKIVTYGGIRKKDLKDNFFLSDKNFGDFYIVGSSENFADEIEDRKYYIDAYLKIQISILRLALKNDDTDSVDSVMKIISNVKKYAIYSRRRRAFRDVSQVDSDETTNYVEDLWNALLLGVQAWAITQYLQGKVKKDITLHLFNVYPWKNLEHLTMSYAMSIKRQVDNIMGWDWWEIEDKSVLDDGGSFGGFEKDISKAYVLQAIKKISELSEEAASSEKTYASDDSYFNLLISENNIIGSYLEELREHGDQYYFLFESRINSKANMDTNLDKLRSYLLRTKASNDSSWNDRIVSSPLDQQKIESFKAHFIDGYVHSSLIRKLLVDAGNVSVDNNHETNKYFGHHLLLDRESFVSFSTLHHESLASHYGEQLAAIEDYLIGDMILKLDGRKVKTKRLYSAKNLRSNLDPYLSSIPEDRKEKTVIYVLGSFTAEERLSSRGEYFEWSNGNTGTYMGKYRGFRVYSSSVGEQKGVVVFDEEKSIKVIQEKPKVRRGVTVGADRHIAFLLEPLSDNEVNAIKNAREAKGEKNVDVPKLKSSVRFWSFVGIRLEIQDKNTILKINIQTDD